MDGQTKSRIQNIFQLCCKVLKATLPFIYSVAFLFTKSVPTIHEWKVFRLMEGGNGIFWMRCLLKKKNGPAAVNVMKMKKTLLMTLHQVVCSHRVTMNLFHPNFEWRSSCISLCCSIAYILFWCYYKPSQICNSFVRK